MHNIQKLKGKRVERNKTQSDVAKALNLDLRTYNYKENGKTEFKTSEVKELAIFLELTPDEVQDIFFS